jgi:YD repeat-containing protein
MTQLRENSTTVGTGVLQTYAWDTLSRRSATTPLSRSNGTTTSYGYDTASRLTSLGHELGGTSFDATLGFGYTAASLRNSPKSVGRFT